MRCLLFPILSCKRLWFPSCSLLSSHLLSLMNLVALCESSRKMPTQWGVKGEVWPTVCKELNPPDMSELGSTLLLAVFRQGWFSWHLEGSLVSDQSQKTQLSSDLDSWPTKTEIIIIAVSHTHTHTQRNSTTFEFEMTIWITRSRSPIKAYLEVGLQEGVPSQCLQGWHLLWVLPHHLHLHTVLSQTRFHLTMLTKVKKSWKPLSYLRPLFYKQENQAQRSMLIKDSQTERSADNWELSNIRENWTLYSTNGRSPFGKVLNVITI